MEVIGRTKTGLQIRTIRIEDDSVENSSTRWKQRNPELANLRQREYNRRWRTQNKASYRRAYQKSNQKRHVAVTE